MVLYNMQENASPQQSLVKVVNTKVYFKKTYVLQPKLMFGNVPLMTLSEQLGIAEQLPF